MRKTATKFSICLLLVILIISWLQLTSFAQQNDVEEKIELSVISANVSGLPSFVSKYDRNVQYSQKTLGKMLNDRSFDIICVQEDFGYHNILSAEMTNYPYKTYTSGPALIGDGLNIFSKYPFYNVERVAWKKSNGIFTDGSDALTPKGFIKCTVDINGILIDLYNVHMDAYRTEADQYAKKAQLIQLTEYMKTHSNGRPVIVTGDTNLTFHTDPLANTYSILIEENGLRDCWVELKNDGNYMQAEKDQAIIDGWYEKFGGHDWGRWDSVERLLYKNCGGLSFAPVCFEYEVYSDNADDKKSLTDHRIMEGILEIDASDYESSTDNTLKAENKPSVFYRVSHGGCMLLRCLGVLLLGSYRFLIVITEASPYMKLLLSVGALCTIYGSIGVLGFQIIPKKFKGRVWTPAYIRCQGARHILLGASLLLFYFILIVFYTHTSIMAGRLLLIPFALSIPSYALNLFFKKKFHTRLADKSKRAAR